LSSTNTEFVQTLRRASILSTEIFIISRPFIECIDEYINALYIILSDQRITHSEIKQKIDIQTKLKSQLAKHPKVSPEGMTAISDSSQSTIFLLKKRLEKIEASLKNRDKKLQDLIDSKLSPAYAKTLDAYSDLWTALSQIFTGIRVIMNNVSVKQNGIAAMPAALSKQAENQKISSDHLSEWLSCAQHCVFSWGDLVKSETLHSTYLYNWVSSRNSEVYIINIVFEEKPRYDIDNSPNLYSTFNIRCSPKSGPKWKAHS
jgi:hypothetical protein